MASEKTSFKIIFWGTRGSVPVLQPEYRRYGGNTSCIEVQCGKRTLILDSGSGIYPLSQKRKIKDVDILFSHTHLDHIQGLPFFKPLYQKGAMLRLWAGHLGQKDNLEDVLGSIFSPLIFPLSLKQVNAKLQFKHFSAGKSLNLGDGITVKTLQIPHPGHATAYRIQFKGKSVCYVTDLEHMPGKIDSSVMKFIAGTDLFIYDASFDDAEMEKYKGWGHSSWQQGARLAKKAKVKKYLAFHHAPEATDTVLDTRSKALKKLIPNAALAKDGLTVTLSK